MLYICRVKYTGFITPTKKDHVLLLPKKENEDLKNIKLKIFIIPNYVSIKTILQKPELYKEYNNNKAICNIFIVTTTELTTDLVTLLESQIHEDYKSTLIEFAPPKPIKVISTIETVHLAIDIYKCITLHFTEYATENYIYKNTHSFNKNVTHQGDDCVEYLNFASRYSILKTTHGKVTGDGQVNIFNAYPIDTAYKVVILPNDWYILPQSNNKIAIKQHANIMLWMVTLHTFINTGIMTYPIGTSVIEANKLTNLEIDYIIDIFNKLEFYNLTITERGISSTDEINSLFIFSGLMYQQEFGAYQNIIQQYGLT